MIGTLLIANRGEIACRIIATCHRLGVRSVAVYSDADAAARHVRLADAAFRIGPPPAPQSYLDIPALIAAAEAAGADAVHPGYGFLAESAEFAEACAAAGLVFVGPPPDAIRAMGSKARGRALMEEAGVPVLPGDAGDDQSDAALARAAARIGFPVLIKPSAGGGGRGMRVVRKPAEAEAALAAARREAKASFGDDHLLLEKYLERPRHVEVQIFGDADGEVIHLYERDCSVQRRHQKIVEEAPAPGVPAETRTALGEAAVAAGRAVGYRGAGTVEFLLDRDGAFYFIEMNTRLQVEHGVSELITGLDLVEGQLRVAGGERWGVAQDDIAPHGHAIELRICAEDPARGFIPSTGVLRHLRLPEGRAGVRVDTGVDQGDAVTPYYDSLVAKLMAHDRDRARALHRLSRALAEVEIDGPATNLAFLAAVVAHPAFAAGDVATDFVERHRKALLARPPPPGDEALALAALAVLADRAAAAGDEPVSPWRRRDGWRLNAPAAQRVELAYGETVATVGATPASATPGGTAWRLDLPGGPMTASAQGARGERFAAVLGGRRVVATVLRTGAGVTVYLDGRAWPLSFHDPVAAAAAAEPPAPGALAAPMPGTVVAVLVAEGAAVRRGDPLLVLEAMKVEHTIRAPADGTVAAVPFAVGDRVEEGAELARIAPG